MKKVILDEVITFTEAQTKAEIKKAYYSYIEGLYGSDWKEENDFYGLEIKINGRWKYLDRGLNYIYKLLNK